MEPWVEYLPGIVASVVVFGAAGVTTLHAIIHKTNSRAAIGWIGLVWLSPVVGVVLYLLLGVNRIRRQAKTLRQNLPSYHQPPPPTAISAEQIPELIPEAHQLVSLARVGESNVQNALVAGNRLEPLYNGDAAYAEMLRAIDEAEQSVSLVSYIFNNDTIGKRFADALERAVERDVQVRVLVDAAGARYSFPSIIWELGKRDVPVAKFLPSSLFPPYILSANLRNHRKVMIVDGKVGFTGGINIRDDCVLEDEPKFPTRDLHFRVEGPVVSQLQEVFAEDWTFTTGEELEGQSWFPELREAGGVIARGIPDGPDEDIDRLRWALHAAIRAAESSIRIVTPYFLPDEALVEAMVVASMRGITIDVVMPRKNNLRYVAWAAMDGLDPLLKHGVRVWFEEGPFDHSKVTVVDDAWVILGSPNWDPRSLRLNFEFSLECYDRSFATSMCEYVDERIGRASQMTYEKYKERGILERLRDGVFRLFAPYL